MSSIAVKAGKRHEPSKAYLDWIRRFPLRPLRSEKDRVMASKILDELVGREDLEQGERDYMEGLARFLTDYEETHRQSRLSALTPLELLKHLMEENEMTTTDLGYVLGSRGLASEVLNGKRGLSKTLIAKLAAKFNVKPSLFLESRS